MCKRIVIIWPSKSCQNWRCGLPSSFLVFVECTNTKVTCYMLSSNFIRIRIASFYCSSWFTWLLVTRFILLKHWNQYTLIHIITMQSSLERDLLFFSFDYRIIVIKSVSVLTYLLFYILHPWAAYFLLCMKPWDGRSLGHDALHLLPFNLCEWCHLLLCYARYLMTKVILMGEQTGPSFFRD